MPELPEVERARALLERAALGRRITAVDDCDEWVCRPHRPGEIAGALEGATLVSAHRRGKAMWVETDRDAVLGLHLGMAGRLVVDDAEAGDRPRGEENGHPRGWDRFTLTFADGGRMALRDKRRLGRVRLDPDLDGVGPDAAEVSRAVFRSAVGTGRAALKARIMDQSVIAGVGNLLADEILWRARLDPRRPAGELADDQLDHLRRTLRAATRDAIRRGGVHTGEIIPFRRRGAACPRCGAPMESATIGGRTTWWCAVEQR
jgi:formamidopyrimidine-DNA glycosylase